MTTHVGHYRTLSKAYERIVRQIVQLKGFGIEAPPAIEIYRTTRVDAQNEMNYTEIYIPVSRTT